VVTIFDNLIKPVESTNKAKDLIKQVYGYKCIVTDMDRQDINRHGSSLDGCHIYPAGSYPQLKKIPVNIIPMVRSLHTGNSCTFDWQVFNKKERSIEDKLKWLSEKVHFDHRAFLRRQLELLHEVVNELV